MTYCSLDEYTKSVLSNLSVNLNFEENEQHVQFFQGIESVYKSFVDLSEMEREAIISGDKLKEHICDISELLISSFPPQLRQYFDSKVHISGIATSDVFWVHFF